MSQAKCPHGKYVGGSQHEECGACAKMEDVTRGPLAKAKAEVSGFGLGICLILIFFWGEPDLIGALIYWLMK